MATDFGLKLKELRENRKWTQGQLAEALGVNLRQVQRYEDDKFPSLDKIQFLTDEFQYDFFDLLGDLESRAKLREKGKASDPSPPNQSEYISTLKEINAFLRQENAASLRTVLQNQGKLAALLRTLIERQAIAEAKIEAIQKKISAKEADPNRVRDILLEANTQYAKIRETIEKVGIDAGVDTHHRKA